ncbi:hypothetical protein [Streptomyces sp. HUCO-GS316]|uniref:hypothetical protein n=1 Tax=Streptomyces sp. HUCO-GS316 TaxID=2692198 RepID=UPI001926BE19|nr:hypothetical protein [Streptomyces sp. HUCO-GS316]
MGDRCQQLLRRLAAGAHRDLRTRITSVWQAVRPFVERERELRGEGGGTYLSIFEELARLAAELPPEHVRDQMAETRRRLTRLRMMR